MYSFLKTVQVHLHSQYAYARPGYLFIIDNVIEGRYPDKMGATVLFDLSLRKQKHT